jgi:CRISPR-associated endonuclease/helicase Cas3
MSILYAHTPPPGGSDWHKLDDHLNAVATLAQAFAEPFGAGELAHWLGLWHDLGKCNPAFQEYLKACYADPNHKGRGPDHKAAGARHALDQRLQPLALLIQAHHGGLKSPTDFKAWFAEKGAVPAVADALARAQQLLPVLAPSAPPALPPLLQRDRTAAELFLRMLFSALVDADFLDTEQHRSPDRAAYRGAPSDLTPLWEQLQRHQRQLSGKRDDHVNQARHAIYQACVEAAALPPGLFRLAVPTGGGKTLSAMAFALRHALAHDLRRAIVAVPFISITEQTADVYRGIFSAGTDEQPVVLEHHSGANNRDDGSDYDPQHMWARLAAENWDTPIVVTTTVQLFQSLFANGTSPCRKLHRLARSVIILDEAQALPPHLLQPILDVLQQLCTHYGATVVISTATQPAFESIPIFAQAQAREIVPDAAHWFDALRRVEYDWRNDTALSWDEMADLLRAEPQALAVLNTKKDALALLEALDDPSALHLSTLLCGAHRRAVITSVKQRLANDAPCRLISTQVVEAGVDLDFPFVLRALGPLDSVIQAAGRCNRNGRLERGRVVVVRPAEGGTPPGAYKTATGVTEALLGADYTDADNPDVARRYFQQLFATVNTDGKGIQALRESLNYPEVATQFRIIDDDTEDVIVHYGSDDQQDKAQRAIARLRRDQTQARFILRQLQPFMVSLRRREAERYRKQGFIDELLPGVGLWLGKYDSVRGLVAKDDLDLDRLVI